MESKKCPNCGLVNFPDAKNCSRCNSELSITGTVFCKSCGAIPTFPPAKSSNVEAIIVLGVIAFLVVGWAGFGSFFYFLAVLFLVGLIAEQLFKRSAKRKCPNCGASGSLIPASSPIAQQFRKDSGNNPV